MRQATAYVDVEAVPMKYDVNREQEFQVFTDPMKVRTLVIASIFVTTAD